MFQEPNDRNLGLLIQQGLALINHCSWVLQYLRVCMGPGPTGPINTKNVLIFYWSQRLDMPFCLPTFLRLKFPKIIHQLSWCIRLIFVYQHFVNFIQRYIPSYQIYIELLCVEMPPRVFLFLHKTTCRKNNDLCQKDHKPTCLSRKNAPFQKRIIKKKKHFYRSSINLLHLFIIIIIIKITFLKFNQFTSFIYFLKR